MPWAPWGPADTGVPLCACLVQTAAGEPTVHTDLWGLTAPPTGCRTGPRRDPGRKGLCDGKGPWEALPGCCPGWACCTRSASVRPTVAGPTLSCLSTSESARGVAEVWTGLTITHTVARNPGRAGLWGGSVPPDQRESLLESVRVCVWGEVWRRGSEVRAPEKVLRHTTRGAR